MAQSRIRIGVLSTSNIGRRSTIPAVLELPEKYELAGIASRTLEGAEVAAKEFNCRAFGSYEEILDKKIIDAVYIPLPNSMHYEWVKKALQNGIHVIVEKSLACSLSEVKELNEIAEENDVSLFENFQFRFHRQLQVIKDRLDSGEIGTLRYMRSSFEFPPFPDSTNIRYSKELQGGALFDAGAYPTRISQIFLGKDISVKAAMLRYGNTYEVDLGGGAFISQDNGDLYSEISFGFDNYYQCTVELFGTKGKISANRIFTSPPGHSPIVTVETQGNASQAIQVEPDNHFKNMLAHFYEIVYDSALRQQEYIQNINQSRLLEEIFTIAHEK